MTDCEASAKATPKSTIGPFVPGKVDGRMDYMSVVILTKLLPVPVGHLFFFSEKLSMLLVF